MKTLVPHAKYLICVLLVALLFSACYKNLPAGPKNKTLNTDSLANILEGKLKNNCIGYAFAISYKSDLKTIRSGGEARRSQDPPAKKMSVLEYYSIASVSKTITAVAFFKSIQSKRNVTENSLIWPYLPTHWKLGKGIKGITFKELLTHTSGFRISPVGAGNDYAHLKELVAGGVDQADKTYSYNNRNFSIFRLLIPILAGYDIPEISPATPAGMLPAMEYAQASQYANDYIDYCRKNIFEKISVADASCNYEPGTNYGLFYAFPADSRHGKFMVDNTLFSGGEGWVLNTVSMANFFRTLHYTEKILPQATSDKMKDSLMGYDRKGKTNDGVYYYWKNGIYTFSDVGYHSLIIGFDNDIQIAAMTSSIINLENIVITSFQEWYK